MTQPDTTLDTPASTQFASNQADAATALGVDEETWDLIRLHGTFPPRTKQGWDLTAIREWIASQPESAIDFGDKPPQPTAGAADLEPRPLIHRPAATITVTITLPACEPDPASYIADMSGRINTRLDREGQLDAFKRVHSGLREANFALANGRPVDGAADVIRWIFEQIHGQLKP